MEREGVGGGSERLCKRVTEGGSDRSRELAGGEEREWELAGGWERVWVI